MNYRLRKNYVIVRVTFCQSVGGLHFPDLAKEGKNYHVVATGPDVTDLHVGDRVILFADNEATFFQIPETKDLVVLKEQYVSAVVEADGVEEDNTDSSASQNLLEVTSPIPWETKVVQ